jgi:hypothetical protein
MPVYGQVVVKQGQNYCPQGNGNAYLGCIPTQGCGDFPTSWCTEEGEYAYTPDTCGPPGYEECDFSLSDC